MQRLLRAGLFLLAIGTIAPSAMGVERTLQEVPVHWKLENYSNDRVVVWLMTNGVVVTPTDCPANSSLKLPVTYQVNPTATTTSADRTRFWNMVMLAKTTGMVVALRYDTTYCEILSFALAAE